MTFESKHNASEIESALAAYRAGADRKRLCASLGISARTLYRWQARAGASRPALMDMVSSLRDENSRLRELLAMKDNELSAP